MSEWILAEPGFELETPGLTDSDVTDWAIRARPQEMQRAQETDSESRFQMCQMSGYCSSNRWQTTERGQSQSRQPGSCTVFLLPWGHSVCSWGLWSSHNHMGQDCVEEIQGPYTSTYITTPVTQDQRPCVQHMCKKRHAPCQWNLGFDKAKPTPPTTKWQGYDSTCVT